MEKYTRNNGHMDPIRKDPDLNRNNAQSYSMNPYKDKPNPLELIDISKYKAMIKYNTQTGGTALQNTNNDERNQSNASEYNDKVVEKNANQKYRSDTRNFSRKSSRSFQTENSSKTRYKYYSQDRGRKLDFIY